MVVFICTLIFLISRMHTCIPVVCINVCGGGGGGGWGGIVMWVCKQEIDVRGCACVLIDLFLTCV